MQNFSTDEILLLFFKQLQNGWAGWIFLSPPIGPEVGFGKRRDGAGKCYGVNLFLGFRMGFGRFSRISSLRAGGGNRPPL